MEHAKTRAASGVFRRLARALAVSYPLALLAVCAAFTAIGERHWFTTGLLYVPRALFAAPAALLVPTLWLTRSRSLLWTQAVALLLALIPLMGFEVPWPAPTARGPALRVLSYNIDTARAGNDKLLAVVDRLSPDLVLFQESSWEESLLDGLRARYPHVDRTTQFIIASRYPILELTPPPPPPEDGRPHLQRFMRYLIDSSLGKLAVYSLHPVSPRGLLGVERAQSLLRGAPLAAVMAGNYRADLALNGVEREQQLAQAVTLADREPYPVLLAGDTNLPGLSRALRTHTAGYADAFARAGSGFGYTFPAKRPFLRIDRVMARPGLDFSEFRVGCPDASDHCWVFAQVFRS